MRNSYIYYIIKILVICSTVIQNSDALEVRIGALLDNKEDINRLVLEHACEAANENILKNSDIELSVETRKVEYGDVYAVAQELCDLLEFGVVSVFGPKSLLASAHASSICDAKEIPYIDPYFDLETKLSIVNMYPSQNALGQFLIDVVNASGWTDFTVLYETPSWLPRVAPLLQVFNDRGYVIPVRRIDNELENKNTESVFNLVKQWNATNILIQCSNELLPEVMAQALQFGLLSEFRHIIIADLDAQTIDLEPYQYSGANITIFRLIDPQNPLLTALNNFLDSTSSEIEPEAEMIETHTALLYDGVMLLAESLKQLGAMHIQTKSKFCEDSESVDRNGYTITNFMKNGNISGLTGHVEFDTYGLRSNIVIDIMELSYDGLQKVGYWVGADEPRLKITKKGPVISKEDGPINEKTFIVIIALSEPYIMLKATSTELYGNDRFEGFGIDIIEELSKYLGFKYEFVLQDDKDYGKLNNVTNEWSGMMGAVISGKADLTITDLTITAERISALDFTPSFMNLGIAILHLKPKIQPPSTFSFMSPFSQNVWLFLGGAYIMVSLCFFCLGRISPSQWENPYPCIEEPTHLENQFSLQNSMWFAIGALLQQGSEIEPKAASIRLASSVWWFFTLIMVSSYTANLAAFLVVQNKEPLFKDVNELQDCYLSDETCPVPFGAKNGGSTLNFFKASNNSVYNKIYKYMEKHSELWTQSNEEGLNKVKEGSYAYLMESSSIQYYTERHCELAMVGELLDDKDYGIGMRKDYKYYNDLSEGILRLQERGILSELQSKWWKQRKGGGACSNDEADGGAVPLEIANVIGVFYVLAAGVIFAKLYALVSLLWEVFKSSKKNKEKDSSAAEELGIKNLKGIFLVLFLGCIFACFYGCVESLLTIYRKAKKNKITFKDELIAELKFLLRCQGNIKEVRHRKSTSMSQHSGVSYRSNRSHYSPVLGRDAQVNGSNTFLHYRGSQNS